MSAYKNAATESRMSGWPLKNSYSVAASFRMLRCKQDARQRNATARARPLRPLQIGQARRHALAQGTGRRGRKIFAGVDEPVALELVLLVVELLVPTVSREQFLVRATFDYAAAFQHKNLVGAADRGETVRDDEGRAPAPKPAQPILN